MISSIERSQKLVYARLASHLGAATGEGKENTEWKEGGDIVVELIKNDRKIYLSSST